MKYQQKSSTQAFWYGCDKKTKLYLLSGIFVADKVINFPKYVIWVILLSLYYVLEEENCFCTLFIKSQTHIMFMFPHWMIWMF